MQRGFAPILIVLFIGLMLVGVVGAGYLTYKQLGTVSSGNRNTTAAVPAPTDTTASQSATAAATSPSPSPFPSTVVPKGYQRMNFLTIDSTTNSFQFLDQVTIKSATSFGSINFQLLNNGYLMIYDTNTVSIYDPINKTQQQLYQNTNSSEIIRARLSEDQRTLYVSKATPLGNYQFTVNLEVINLPNTLVRTVSNVPPVTYGALDYLMDSPNGDIVGSFGGDGCGGFGKVYQVKDGQNTELLKTGAGCNNDPYYLGELESKNSLLLEEHHTGANDADIPTKLLIYDVATKQSTPLLDLTAVSSQIRLLKYDRYSQTVYLFVDKELWKYNPTTKVLQKSVVVDKLPSEDIYWAGVTSSHLIGYNYKSKELALIETATKQQSTIKWNLPVGFAPQFVGVYAGKLLFAVIQSPVN